MADSGPRFTVICWSTASYRYLAEGLAADCRRLGYPFHLYEIGEEYASLVHAWCNHPRTIRRGVKDFGTVLFLDAECRIVAPIPDSWGPPLVSVRNPPQKFWIRYNTGTVMADVSCLPWIDAWLRIVEEWDLAHLDDDDYVHWPGDLNDEVALAAALAASGVRVRTPRLEYADRTSDAEIARGLWTNRHTVVQHPTVHHWPGETDPAECKKLFQQNYPGDPAEGAGLFAGPRRRVERHGWVFDPERRLYAPREHWPAAARPWTDEEVTLTSAQR